MTLFKLKTAPVVLLEDDRNVNVLPLLNEITQENYMVNMFCYEHSIDSWKSVFRRRKVNFYKSIDQPINKYTKEKCSVIIDSVNQMCLCSSWTECIKIIKSLSTNPNVVQVIMVLHKDCLLPSSKLQLNLRHLSNSTITFEPDGRVCIVLKKSGKMVRTFETLSYDVKNKVVKLTTIIKKEIVEDEPEKPSPCSLTTFKIEIEQTDKLEKYKLKLPYMSKINEGESKVYYEPDAVDDWDEEDPDEDLDI